MSLVLTGSGPVLDLLPGCRCARCRALGPRAPLALRLPSGSVLDGDSPAGRVVDGGLRVLWSPGCTVLDEADVAILTPAPDDHDLTGVARAAAALRPARVVLAGLTHDHPRAALGPLPAAWGVHRPADGTDLTRLPELPGITGRTLVLGGASSGKSGHAEALLAAQPEVRYLATGPMADDADWARRVRAHRERRPKSWKTDENPYAVDSLGCDEPVLLDSVGTWLAAALDRAGAWDSATGWRERFAGDRDALVAAWRTRTGILVAVSDEVGLGVVPATAAGRLFREELGRLNARLAEESDRVVLVVAGVPTDIITP